MSEEETDLLREATSVANDDEEEIPPLPNAPMAQDLPLLHHESPPTTACATKAEPKSGGRIRKNPKAPKRFKSSYILFFMAKQAEIKDQLGKDANVSSISKKSAELWKNLAPAERAFWDEKAAADKARYNMEKLQYTGSWQIPWKRQKKDPSAPKRPMSAFLFFSQVKRSEVQAANPTYKNVDISRMLGKIWRSMSTEDKAPFVEIEEKAREKYKVEIEKWKTQKAERTAAAQQEALQEAEFQELQQETLRQEGFQPDGAQGQSDFMLGPLFFPPDGIGATSNNGMMSAPYMMQSPNFYGQHLHAPSPYASMPPQTQSTGLSLPLPTTGKPVVLGPAGVPVQPVLQPATISNSIFDDAFDFAEDVEDASE